MNYQKIYDSLINKAKNRILDCYTEKHHIIPKCLGGSDEECNLVSLTGREHFLAHWLLYRIYPTNGSLATAFFFMSHCLNGSRNYKVSSRAYQESRQAHAIAMRVKLTGIVRSEETRRKLSSRVVSQEWRRKVGIKSKGRNVGRKISDQQKKSISLANKGRKLTDEQKQKISETHRGKTISLFQRKRMSEANKGKIVSEETRRKMSLARRRREELRTKIECE